MVRTALSTAAIAATALFGTAFAQTKQEGVKGTRDQKCPAEAPCGGLYHDCGVGAFCLGGCDPTISHSFDSCVPNPICKSGTYKFNQNKDQIAIDDYLGDSSKANWVTQGSPKPFKDQGLDGTLLTMGQGTVGTLLASSFYVLYGKICAKMTTSRGAGVVTAFIMMSDVKDEIDFEWIGTDIANAQSNWYSQGVTDYTNGKNLSIPGGDSYGKPHEYCIDWKEDSLTWSIDGNNVRTMKREETKNATSGKYDYPQTPSRVMLSLWPAGLPSNEKGTIEWAGGEIQWDSPYMTKEGYYYAYIEQVTIECYDAPSNVKKNGKKSYKYTDKAVTQETIELSDDITVLGSLQGTGEKPGEAAKTTSGSDPSKTVASVPGGVQGGGARQEGPAEAATTDGSGQAGSGGSGGSGTSSSEGFDQGVDASAGVALGGPGVAIVVAMLALVVL